MATEETLDWLGYGYALFLFVLPPLLILLPAWIFRWRSRFFRFCVATLIPWFGVQEYRLAFVWPLAKRVARDQGDLLYDGTGEGAALFIMGFIIPAFLAALTLLAEYLVQHRR